MALKMHEKHSQSTGRELLVQLESNIAELEGNLSTILQSVRGTKQYWHQRNSELNALVRDFGPPTLLLTFSCAEYNSADITEYLKLVNGFSSDASVNITHLCTEDPISMSRQFSQKFKTLFSAVILKGQVLGKVTCRGTPRHHVLLWIEGAPVIGVHPDDVILSWNKTTNPELYYLVTQYQN